MNLMKTLKGNETLTNLKWWDLLAVTLIMFGNAIYTSTLGYLYPPTGGYAEATEFSAAENYSGIIFQGALLLAAFIYLRLRNFNFSQWKIKITPKSIVYGVLLFIVIALAMDAYFMVAARFEAPQVLENVSLGEEAYEMSFPPIDVSVILYALLNGFYEEIFFLGMCLAVDKKYTKLAFAISLIIRFSFHTYQGMVPAIGIGFVLGTLYYVIYEKTERKNMYPFFLSHSIADVLGAGILMYIMH